MVAPVLKRYGVIDTHTALHDGLSNWLLLFDKVVVSGLPGVRSFLGDVDFYDPIHDERAWQRPDAVLWNALGVLGQGDTPAEEAKVRRFLAECDFLIERGVMEEPPVQNYAWRTALELDEARFRTGLSLREPSAEIHMAPNATRLTSMPASFDNAYVMQYVLRQMPVPRSDVPLEEIVAFRAEDGNRQKLSRLRSWIGKQARDAKSPLDLENNLLAAYDDYANALKLLDRQHGTSTLSVVVSMAAEAIDAVTSFKWGSAMKAIFDVSKQQLEWDKGEAKAPGREVAYLHAVERAFRR